MPNARFTHGYALIIGIGADLPVTIQDATAFYNVLVDPARASYPHEQTQLLTEAKASKKSILDAFDKLIKQVNNNPDATAIIYFSGHGGYIKLNSKATGYFLIPHGYNPARHTSTAISGLEFTRKIKAIKARKLLVLLDCCHAAGMSTLKAASENFEKSPMPPSLLSKLEQGSGHVIVASSRKEEYSYTGAPYSIFTTCLLEALAGKGTKNEDGYARVLDILTYLFDTVPLRATGPQHPFVNNIHNLDDNFPLCYYAGGSKEVSEDVGSSKLFSSSSVNSDSTEQFDVFISYAETNATWVKAMAERLEDEAHLYVWLDKWQLIPGKSYQQSIARGLDQAKSCVVCIGENTPVGWFQQQIERALDRQARETSFRVIPVLLPDANDVNVDNFLELRSQVNFRDTDPNYAFHLLERGIKGLPPGRWPPSGNQKSL